MKPIINVFLKIVSLNSDDRRAVIFTMPNLFYLAYFQKQQNSIFKTQATEGRLVESGSPVTGIRYFRFTLFDENGAAIPGATVEQALMVTQGVFSTSLDFGADAFPGANRSLQISVKTNAGDAYTDLNPRQNILAAPYSVKSKEADNAARLGGVDSTRFVQQDAGGNVTIAGGLTVNGSLSLDTVNAQTQYNLGGNRVLSIGSGNGSLALGTGTGNPNSSSFSTFIGQSAGANNTGGSNTFVGANAGAANTTGESNSIFGEGSGQFNTTGSRNSFFGRGAANFNVSGNDNAFFGFFAGYKNTASGNAFFGANAGRENATGGNNAFFGINAGISNAGGSFNSFFGNNAGYDNTSGILVDGK
jgi:hypothetical protein